MILCPVHLQTNKLAYPRGRDHLSSPCHEQQYENSQFSSPGTNPSKELGHIDQSIVALGAKVRPNHSWPRRPSAFD
jgi:hypothetical protein